MTFAYAESELDHYDLSLTDLASDLRDGVRLTRLVISRASFPVLISFG